MHKKMWIIFLLVSVIIVSGCSGTDGESSQTGPKNWNVKIYRCDLPMNECTRDMWQTSLVGEGQVLIDENLQGKNSLLKGFANDNAIASIFSLDNQLNTSAENMFIDKRKNTISISEPTNQRCINKKIYDITLDLTYHDYNSKDKGYVEEYLRTHRIEQLRNYLEGSDNPKIKLQEGDVINLRFLGTIEFQGTSSPLMDRITLHYMSKCEDTETTFEVLHDTIEHNARHSEIRLFYGLKQVKSDKDTDTVGGVYASIDSMMKKVEDEFNQRYGKHSEGTFLLNHLVNNSILTQYKKNQITMLFFDGLFQLSHSDRETFVKKYGNFPASIYEFNVNNIKNSYKEGFFFKNFFINHIFKELPILTTLCPISTEGDSLDVYIIGMNVVNDLTVQSSMKDFYTNHLFKNCNVFYQ